MSILLPNRIQILATANQLTMYGIAFSGVPLAIFLEMFSKRNNNFHSILSLVPILPGLRFILSGLLRTGEGTDVSFQCGNWCCRVIGMDDQSNGLRAPWQPLVNRNGRGESLPSLNANSITKPQHHKL